jgi:uncharacterized membrane protein YczE
MPQHSWRSHFGVVAIVLALVLVTQPELRALIFLVDTLGFDMFAFVVGLQARSVAPLVCVMLVPVLMGLGRGLLGPLARSALVLVLDRLAWQSLAVRALDRRALGRVP